MILCAAGKEIEEGSGQDNRTNLFSPKAQRISPDQGIMNSTKLNTYVCNFIVNVQVSTLNELRYGKVKGSEKKTLYLKVNKTNNAISE